MTRAAERRLRTERECGEHRPRRDGAVVRPKGNPARHVTVEPSVARMQGLLIVARPITCRDAPKVATIRGEAIRIARRVLALDGHRVLCIAKVIEMNLAHELVLDVAKID